jgi:protein-S-isoprenylcysteine O-methyltransferase Ste14
MDTPKDIPGVIAPPPLIGLAVAVAGLVLDRLLPAYVLAVLLSTAERIVTGAVLMAAGLSFGITAVGAMRAVRTHVEPWKPSTVLVTTGVFAWLRNPIYVGMGLVLGGLAVMLGSDWMLVLTILAAPLIHYGVVLREERYLAAKFGESYRQYVASVPRYGWPF